MLIKNVKVKQQLPFNKILILLIFFICCLFIINLDFFKLKILKQNLVFTPSNNFSDEEIQLEIVSPIKNAKIFYTLDGSPPSPQSLFYEKGDILLIKDNIIIKAALFKNDKQLSTVVYKNYFINFNSDLAIIALSTDPHNLWDDEIGIYVPGINPATRNYLQRDDSWKRRAELSFFENKQEIFSRIIDIKISGGSSAAFPQKSFNIYFNNSSNDNSISYQIFPQSSNSNFNSLKLRNSGNDWYSTLIRDCLMQELLRGYSDLDLQACRPAVLILNGQYWGIYNIRERYNESYFVNKYSDYKLDSKKIIIASTTNEPGKIGHPIIRSGSESDGNSYLNLINFAQNNDLSITANYQAIAEKIDIDNFIDYNIAQMFYGNYDWPHGNVKFWSYRSHIFDDPISIVDGRWRWLIFDTDFGFALEGNNKINTIAKDDAISLDLFYKLNKEEFVFKKLFDNQEFRDRFVIRYFDLLNSSFRSKKMLDKINELSSQIDSEIIRHSARWGNQTDGMFENYEDWQKNIERLRTFAKERPQFVISHLEKFFEFPGTYQLKIDKQGPCQGTLIVNSLEIDSHQLPWTATYPINYQLNIEFIADSECLFDSWINDELDKELLGKNSLKINPKKDLELLVSLTTK